MSNDDSQSDSDDNEEYLGTIVDIPVATKVYISPPNEPHWTESRERAVTRSIHVNTAARLIMVLVIAGIFIGLNWAVMSFVHDAFLNDVTQMAAKPPLLPADRLITTEVVMSLIGATVVQVGVAVIAIVSYLFPKQN